MLVRLGRGAVKPPYETATAGVEVHLPGHACDGQIDKTPAQIVLERLHQLGIETPSATHTGHNTDGTPDDESDVVDAEVESAVPFPAR